MTRGRRSRWIREHQRDTYVQHARTEGYRSRAAYKLLELDDREKLLETGCVVVDLGAAPGGWSQVAAQRAGPQGLVVALDVLPMEPLDPVHIIQGDFTEVATTRAIESTLGGRRPDLILSDMAPNLAGIKAVDAARSADLAERALAWCEEVLTPGGNLVMKVFQRAGFDQVRIDATRVFRSVRIRKPSASRPRSAETYMIGKGFGL